MKFLLTSFCLILFMSNGFSQDRKLSIYGAFGYQDYRGDRGNGLFDHRRCVWGAGHFGVDYSISNSFDVKLHFSGGAMGYLQTRETKILLLESGVPEDHGEEHEHIQELEDLNSALFGLNLNLQYKVANGYLLPKTSKITPTFYLGIGVNRITDVMKMNCVNVGNYCTINTGLSIPYHFADRFYVAYNLDFGVFTSDKLDFVDKGGNDMFMQNSIALGFDVF